MSQTEQPEQIPVLRNVCLGGFNPSELAIDRYNTEMLKLNPDFVPITSLGVYDLDRHDPVLVQIFKELGEAFDGDCSKTKIEYINTNYKNYYNLENYDGCEKLIINTDIYKMYKLTTN